MDAFDANAPVKKPMAVPPPRVYAGGPIKQPQKRYMAYDFFVYELDIASIAAAASTTQTFTIQADSDFFWTKATYFADLAAAAQTDSGRIIPLCTVLIQDTGSGRNLMSSAVPVPSLFGTGELPMILPRQRLFLARAQVQVTVTNYSAASTYGLRLSFIGEKAFA
jgi:hypothetical protein